MYGTKLSADESSAVTSVVGLTGLGALREMFCLAQTTILSSLDKYLYHYVC